MIHSSYFRVDQRIYPNLVRNERSEQRIIQSKVLLVLAPPSFFFAFLQSDANDAIQLTSGWKIP